MSGGQQMFFPPFDLDAGENYGGFIEGFNAPKLKSTEE
jgi:hypothetical protein